MAMSQRAMDSSARLTLKNSMESPMLPRLAQAGGVDQHVGLPHALGLHFERHIHGVAGGAGNRADDDALGAGEGVDDGRLADVGAADDGELEGSGGVMRDA